MELILDTDGQRRLTEYFDIIGGILNNDGRRASFAIYALGLLGEGERKSMEPIAARTCPDVDRVDAAHQRLQHFLVDSPWSDREVRGAATRYAVAALTEREPIDTWQFDDTGFLKQGKHSVGVQRQYTGSAGKITNCQLGVSLSLGTRTEQVPIDFELYLPKSWTEDQARRKEARIPESIAFKTKIELALDMARRAIADGVPHGVALADCFYGDEPSFRAGLRSLGLHYAVAVKSDNRVWRTDENGRRRGEPITVGKIASALGRKRFRRVTWRQGVKHPLHGRFATCRVTPAYRKKGDDLNEREAVWLIVEQTGDPDDPFKYYFATLPQNWSKKRLIRLIKERWKTERVYEDMKGELGLDHFEGRRFPGWHHHVSVAICCYAFVVAERVRRFPPTAGRQETDRSLALAA
jgi:SRSO17 transposase